MIELSHKAVKVLAWTMTFPQDEFDGISDLGDFCRGQLNGAFNTVKDPTKDLLSGGPNTLLLNDQLLLRNGILSIMSLFIKRYFERPKRKWYVFFLDFMKQGGGATCVHCSNVIVSLFLQNKEAETIDQCSSYLGKVKIAFYLDFNLK